MYPPGIWITYVTHLSAFSYTGGPERQKYIYILKNGNFRYLKIRFLGMEDLLLFDGQLVFFSLTPHASLPVNREVYILYLKFSLSGKWIIVSVSVQIRGWQQLISIKKSD